MGFSGQSVKATSLEVNMQGQTVGSGREGVEHGGFRGFVNLLQQ